MRLSHIDERVWSLGNSILLRLAIPRLTGPAKKQLGDKRNPASLDGPGQKGFYCIDEMDVLGRYNAGGKV
jgi:hypothetical protein